MAVEVERAVEAPAVVPPPSEDVSSKPQSKKAKQVKFKEPAKDGEKKKKSSTHPPYLQMVKEAISSLQERGGSSQHAIAKFLEDKYNTGLPPTFKRMLSIQLKNMSNNGKLTKVKNSFKLAPKKVRKTSTEPAAAADEKKPKKDSKPKIEKKSAPASKKRSAPPSKASKEDSKPRKKPASVIKEAKNAAAATTMKDVAARDLRAASRASRQNPSAPKSAKSPAKAKKADAPAKRAKRVAAL